MGYEMITFNMGKQVYDHHGENQTCWHSFRNLRCPQIGFFALIVTQHWHFKCHGRKLLRKCEAICNFSVLQIWLTQPLNFSRKLIQIVQNLLNNLHTNLFVSKSYQLQDGSTLSKMSLNFLKASLELYDQF